VIVQNGVQAREKEHEKYMHENRNTRKTLEYDATAEGEWVERGRGHGRVAASGKEERLAQAEKELGASTGTCGDEATRQDTTSARASTATSDTTAAAAANAAADAATTAADAADATADGDDAATADVAAAATAAATAAALAATRLIDARLNVLL
jgi:hypothetical protein